ncbi:MAG: hypothetical protein CL730_03285 [Chloroflexi bacterium]|jgi:hypothetical protein|nr:hypothetical protein [Chloroflexota bacterium]MBO99265.1 hypothetical protein [Chloroflexota bacterium]|tara:strand:+ start:295 stop:558 length:264 start_codon:yes stop_codon:yes gene_type:complete
MIKDLSGKLKSIVNYTLVLFGINGIICVITTIIGLATDRRLLGSYDVSLITSLNKIMWNVQFFSFWVLVIGIVIGSLIAMIYSLFND